MKRKYLFYADKLMDDGASHGQAKGIASTDNAYTDLVKRHARHMVKDGRGDWWFVRVERDNESTLWALEESTVTMHERYITADTTSRGKKPPPPPPLPGKLSPSGQRK